MVLSSDSLAVFSLGSDGHEGVFVHGPPVRRGTVPPGARQAEMVTVSVSLQKRGASTIGSMSPCTGPASSAEVVPAIVEASLHDEGRRRARGVRAKSSQPG